jgi:hypothetical protein
MAFTGTIQGGTQFSVKVNDFFYAGYSVAGGVSNNSYTWSGSDLPYGLLINSNNGFIEGKITDTGVYDSKIFVEDNYYNTGQINVRFSAYNVTGSLYAWGQGRYSQQSIPREISDFPVRAISQSPDHNLVVGYRETYIAPQPTPSPTPTPEVTKSILNNAKYSFSILNLARVDVIDEFNFTSTLSGVSGYCLENNLLFNYSGGDLFTASNIELLSSGYNFNMHIPTGTGAATGLGPTPTPTPPPTPTPTPVATLNWVQSTLSSTQSWWSVAYGNGTFVAVAAYTVAPTTTNIAAYSDNGIDWADATLPSSSNWYSVAYGNGRFVATSNGTGCAYSSDGVTWQGSSLPSSQSWGGITYGDNKFVAVASNSNVAAYSADGISWTPVQLPSSRFWDSITYGNGIFITVARDSNIVAYSSDAVEWTESSVPSVQYWKSITYGNGKFVMLARNSNIAVYSSDGILWGQSVLPANQYWSSVVYGNNKFIAVAYSIGTAKTNIAAYSYDGITWTSTLLPSSQDWLSITYGNNKFVTVAYATNVGAYLIDPADVI